MGRDEDLLLVITSNALGEGELDLGERLMDLYLGNLAKAEMVPARILFMHRGVLLTTSGSSVLAHLRTLEERGVELVSCITCLTYYDRMDRLEAGGRGDMKGSVGDMTRFPRVVTL